MRIFQSKIIISMWERRRTCRQSEKVNLTKEDCKVLNIGMAVDM